MFIFFMCSICFMLVFMELFSDDDTVYVYSKKTLLFKNISYYKNQVFWKQPIIKFSLK